MAKYFSDANDKLPGLQDLFPTACKVGFNENPKNVIYSLTVDICDTYKKRNPQFQYDTLHNPKRLLTLPNEPEKNRGYDNENNDYILYVHGMLGPMENPRKYVILDMLGSGTFGQVVKCKNIETGELVAIKVIKNKDNYTKQSIVEEQILRELNKITDPDYEDKILRLKDSFFHKDHLCLVSELLSVNLYEVIKQNDFKGLSTDLIRTFATQLLDTLILIKSFGIIHCDLKPENVLLKSLDSSAIKVIDFGSSCYESLQTYTYIQSRFYRSPEVLLGLTYTPAIDMWSFGCIIAELYLGLPIFPGSSEYNQLSRIIETIGDVPDYMITEGKYGHRFFNYEKPRFFGEPRFRLKRIEEYSKDRKKQEKPSKHYFSTFDLDKLILKYPLPKKKMTFIEIEKEKRTRKNLLDFLKKVLEIDPAKRLTPEQAMKHPFITGNTHHSHTRYDEVISLGKGILKRSKKQSTNNNSGSDDESKEEEKTPAMLTGVRRKSYANTGERSSLSISPFSRKKFESASTDKAFIWCIP